MLVIDGVELVALDQPHEVRKFHGQRAGGLEQQRQAGDEIVEVGHVGEHVVANQTDRPWRPSADQLLGQLNAEEAHQRRHAHRFRRLGDVAPPARCRAPARRRP